VYSIAFNIISAFNIFVLTSKKLPKIQKMKIFSWFFLFIILVFLFQSCGTDTKQSSSNLSSVSDEEMTFAKTLYGEGVTVLIRGDLLSDGKVSALTGIVKKKTENSFWIEKASFVQQDKDGWKILLKIEQKISTPSGEITGQVESKNGYILSIDSSAKPFAINIVISNEYGKAASDDAQIVWNSSLKSFEFKTPFDDIPQ
jgi:hypothetical protein